ncbi:uncharacterized protein LOC110053333 [Orbicella faveolata]|uniref:uncharacterized protein LOC110053333 n=1 Tax=Orbicella faveolata TaxID=48498 RepID=UPI0009E5421D|nr:uncharacterized protein LOC110053333 [Orbicella faveolata]
MAAHSERESRELLTDALINSQVLNSYTMDEFKELFPRKYRDLQDVKLLYEAYQTKRKQIKDRVLMNIRSHCRQRAQQDCEVTDSKYEADISELEEREQMLQEEIKTMQQDIDKVQEKMGSCADTLEKRKLFSGLHKEDFDISKFNKGNSRNSFR